MHKIIFIILLSLLTFISKGCAYLSKKEKNIILWRNTVGEGTGKYYSYLHPTKLGVLVFAADRYGLVKALNAKNGKKIWIKDLSISTGFMSKNDSALLSGGITAFDKKLYIGSERAKVYAINIYDGSIAWKSNVAGEVLSTPVVSNNDDLVLVHTSNGILQALNIYNGTIKWMVNLNIPQLTIRGESTPNIVFGTVIVGGDNGIISSILLKNGQIIWQQQISYPSGITEITRINDITTNSVVVNDVIYAIAYNGNLVAMDLRSGNIIWYKEIGSYITNLLVKGNYLYIIDQNDILITININNGINLWCKRLYHNITSIIRYKGYIITCDLQGYINWIKQNDGILFNKIKIDSSGLLSTPIIANTKLVVQAKNGIIYSII